MGFIEEFFVGFVDGLVYVFVVCLSTKVIK